MQAFAALRTLAEQQYLARCSSSCTTDDVRIDVTSGFHRVGTVVTCLCAVCAAEAWLRKSLNIFLQITYHVLMNEASTPISGPGPIYDIEPLMSANLSHQLAKAALCRILHRKRYTSTAKKCTCLLIGCASPTTGNRQSR